jgi:rod shape-determining protein MreD
MTVVMALVLLSIESVLVKYLGLSVARIDVTVLIVAFLAVRANTLEGAVSSFALGYMLDLMSGQPTGLFTFLAVLVFLLGRIGGSLVDIRSPISFATFAVGMDLVHALLSSFFTWMTSKGGGSVLPGWSLLLQIGLTGAASLLLFPLLRKVDPGRERPEIGALR